MHHWLDTLSSEILFLLFDHIHEPNNDNKSLRWDIAVDDRRWPLDHPFLQVSPKVHDAAARWFLGSITLCYTSSVSGGYTTGQQAGHDLCEFFARIDVADRKYIKHLRLRMHAAELLMLFAPPETAALLNMPQDRHVWAQVRDILTGLSLNELQVDLLEPLCPQPCNAGAILKASHNWDGSIARHLRPDERWVVKAVGETMNHLSITAFPAYGMLKDVSWAMLESSTEAYHHCGQLAAPELDPERRLRWAEVGDRETIWYRIPMRSVKKHSPMDVMDVEFSSVFW